MIIFLFVCSSSQILGEQAYKNNNSLPNQSIYNNKSNYMFFDGRLRSYLVHIPKSYKESAKTPLLILLHGSFFNANCIRLRSDMDKKADEEGFIVVYPNGATGLLFKLYNKIMSAEPNDRYWNAGFCGGLSYLLGIDDVGYIDAIIEKMQNNYNINSSRIYLSGYSSGAVLTYYIGAKLSEKIAAIAPVGGVIGGKPNDYFPVWIPPTPKYPLNLIIFNG